MLRDILKNNNFNIFFSVVLGIGIICIIRPLCNGSECSIDKPPISKDFDKYVYKIGTKCFEFTPEVKKCPDSGTIEAFYQKNAENKNTFKQRMTRLLQRD